MRRAPSPLLALVAVTAIWGYTFVPVQKAVGAYPLFAFLAAALACYLVLPDKIPRQWYLYERFLVFIAL